MKKTLIPLNLQQFADGGDPAPAPQGNPQPAPTNPNPNPAPAPASQGNTEQLVQTLIAAIDNRQQRAEKSVLKSMAQQYGLEEAELTTMLEDARKQKQNQLPDHVQKQITDATNRANGLLIAAEVKSLGAAMGLVDADVALQLMNREAVKVDDKGVVSGVQDAMNALKEQKPYLFGQSAKPGAWGQQQGNPAPGEKSERVEMREAMFGKRT